MTKVLLVTGSVRPGRAADNVLKLVKEEAAKYPDFEVEVADFKTMPLPFMNSAKIPADESFVAEDENVIAWSNMVKNTDAVVILSPEYNHSYTPVLKNAIDWLTKEWNDKPLAFIGYGWVGGARAIKHLRDVFASSLAPNVIEKEANLAFTKQLNLDGSPIDDTAAEMVREILDEVKKAV